MSKKYGIRKVEESEQISLDTKQHFVVRDGDLYRTLDWRAIEEDELYCIINQTPTTPADFGLGLIKRKGLVYHEPYEGEDFFDKEKVVKYDGWYSPDNDEYVKHIFDYMIINPKDIRGFIMGTKEFKHYYE